MSVICSGLIAGKSNGLVLYSGNFGDRVRMKIRERGADYPPSGSGSWFASTKESEVGWILQPDSGGAPIEIGVPDFTISKRGDSANLNMCGINNLYVFRVVRIQQGVYTASLIADQWEGRLIGAKGRPHKRHRGAKVRVEVHSLPTDAGQALAMARECFSHVIWKEWGDWSPASGIMGGTIRAVQPKSFNFVYNERVAWQVMDELGIVPAGYANQFATAYTAAISSMPMAQVNVLGNILETVSSIKTLSGVIKDPVKGIARLLKGYSDPRNAWLAYRYSYTTTKLDVKEFREFLSRLNDLSKLCNETVTLRGYHTEGNQIFNVSLVMPLSQVIPGDIATLLERSGLKLSASNLWDIVPYSFVVDWFLGIGNLLEWFENWAECLVFEPKEIWFSYKSNYDYQSTYLRVRGRKLDVPPIYIKKNVSGKTFKMRIADAISLFTGSR